MRLTPAFLLVLAGTASLPAQDAVRKEGQYWLREVKGNAPTSGASRMKIITSGRVIVRPDSSLTTVRYTWSQRLKQHSQTNATARLQRLDIQVKSAGAWCILDATAPDDVLSELTIHVPSGLRQYVIDNRTGAISVRGLQGDVQAVTTAGNIDMDEMGAGVVARTGGGSLTFGTVKGSVRCLTGGGTVRATKIGAESILESAGGEIWIEEAAGPIRASTAGNIHVGRAASSVSAHTSGGMIEVENAQGIVTAESAGGAILIGGARGVRAESAGGTIKMRNVSGSIRASTASGNLFVALSGQRALENSFLATGRGDITVVVPSKLPVTVKALNESSGWQARILSDFPEVRSTVPGSMGSGRPVLAEGALNGGGPTLILSVASGTVFLKRQ